MPEIKGLKTIQCDAPGCTYTESFIPKIDRWSRYSGTCLDGSGQGKVQWYACGKDHIVQAIAFRFKELHTNG